MISKLLHQLAIRKLLSTLTLSGMMLFGLLSCNDEPVGPQFGDAQNPIQQLISSITYNQAYPDDGDYIFGCMFEFQEEGRITNLCVQAPDDDTYGLTLWDLSDTTIIISVSVVADSGVLSYADIVDVPVLNGSRVAVTMTSDDYYTWDDGGNNIFPTTVNDVVILGYGYIFNPVGAQFPDVFYSDYYAGLADLVFEPKLE